MEVAIRVTAIEPVPGPVRVVGFVIMVVILLFTGIFIAGVGVTFALVPTRRGAHTVVLKSQHALFEMH